MGLSITLQSCLIAFALGMKSTQAVDLLVMSAVPRITLSAVNAVERGASVALAMYGSIPNVYRHDSVTISKAIMERVVGMRSTKHVAVLVMRNVIRQMNYARMLAPAAAFARLDMFVLIMCVCLNHNARQIYVHAMKSIGSASSDAERVVTNHRA